MKRCRFSISLAAGLLLAAPALAAGSAAGRGATTDPVPLQQQLASERAGITQDDSLQELGSGCPPGPIMEEMSNPTSGSGAGSRKGGSAHHDVIESRFGIIRL